MRIGIWNVRTLHETGRLRQAVACMKNYGLNSLGMSEVRWSEFGEMITQEGATFMYSGRPQDENPSREGVGILMDKEAKRSLIEWYPVSARIIVAHFRTTITNIVIIQCCAPTAVAKEVKRQEFYVQLNEILKKQKKKDIIISGGDLNAKVGQENAGLEHIMGRHGLGKRNENGQLFVDFYARHDLVIGRTIFPHKDCHKVTWVSPDHKTENQTDHTAIG
jgi:exonuclease III